MVLAITAYSSVNTQSDRNNRPRGSAAPLPESKAVAPVAMPLPYEAGEMPKTYVRLKNYAPLVAQLAATAQNMPQTRVLRRADSADGAASYQQTAIVMGGVKVLPSWEA